MPDRDAAYLWDILDTAKQIRALVDSNEPGRFTEGTTERLALERLLEILGIAVMRISQEFRDQHPDIPWRAVIGLRNVIARQYDDIIFDRLWEAVTVDVPELLQQITPLVPPAPE